MAKRKTKPAKAVMKAENPELASKLIAQFKEIWSAAQTSAVKSTHELADIAYRLSDECGMSQLKIAMATGRSQPWISLLLKWREGGYEGTPSIHVPAPQKILPGNNPAVTPDPNTGMPPGNRKLALLEDGSVVRITGNDVDTEASAEARKAAMGAEPAPEPALRVDEFRDTPAKKSKRVLMAGKSWLDENLPDMSAEDKAELFRYYKFHTEMVGVKRAA